MEEGLVVRETEGGWCLGDWEFLDSGKVPEPFVNTALLVGLIRQYHELSGEREYAQLEEQALDALKREYPGLKHIGAATVWAAYVGIESPEVPMRYYETSGCFDTGFLATDVLVELLFQNGYADTAYKLLSSTKTGTFLEMKQRGATTLYEAWGCHRSGSHPMFGACTRSLFQGLLGIRQLRGDAGYQSICFSPALPSAMNNASGSILTTVGKISVDLVRKEGHVAATLTVPTGVTVLNHTPESYIVHIICDEQASDA
jgi:alpha-L-rhamnosidase